MTLQTTALLYIIFSFIFLNGAFLATLNLSVYIVKAYAWRACFIEWLWRMGVVFYAGYLLDDHYRNAPHEFYQNWQILSTFIITCAVFSLPSVVYAYYKKR